MRDQLHVARRLAHDSARRAHASTRDLTADDPENLRRAWRQRRWRKSAATAAAAATATVSVVASITTPAEKRDVTVAEVLANAARRVEAAMSAAVTTVEAATAVSATVDEAMTLANRAMELAMEQSGLSAQTTAEVRLLAEAMAAAAGQAESMIRNVGLVESCMAESALAAELLARIQEGGGEAEPIAIASTRANSLDAASKSTALIIEEVAQSAARIRTTISAVEAQQRAERARQVHIAATAQLAQQVVDDVMMGLLQALAADMVAEEKLRLARLEDERRKAAEEERRRRESEEKARMEEAARLERERARERAEAAARQQLFEEMRRHKAEQERKRREQERKERERKEEEDLWRQRCEAEAAAAAAARAQAAAAAAAAAKRRNARSSSKDTRGAYGGGPDDIAAARLALKPWVDATFGQLEQRLNGPAAASALAWHWFLRLVYSEFPPQSLSETVVRERLVAIDRLQNGSKGILQALKKVQIAMHPDKNRAAVCGAQWAVRAEELSKMASHLITVLKEKPLYR